MKLVELFVQTTTKKDSWYFSWCATKLDTSESECQPLYIEIKEFYESGIAGSSASGRETGFRWSHWKERRLYITMLKLIILLQHPVLLHPRYPKRQDIPNLSKRLMLFSSIRLSQIPLWPQVSTWAYPTNWDLPI
jgi:hypothetical protein